MQSWTNKQRKEKQGSTLVRDKIQSLVEVEVFLLTKFVKEVWKKDG